MIYVNYISKLEKKEGSFQWQKTQEGTNCRDLNMSLKLCAYVLTRDQLFDTLLSMGFSWQEYWSGLPLPPPGDLPNPGIEPESPALAGRFFITEPPKKGL